MNDMNGQKYTKNMQHKGLVNLSSSQSQIEFYYNISPNLKKLKFEIFFLSSFKRHQTERRNRMGWDKIE